MATLRGGYIGGWRKVRESSPSHGYNSRIPCRITSYVNNLHPKKHTDLYGVLEKVIDVAIPSWELTLAPLYDTDFKFSQRISYTSIQYEEPYDEDYESQQGDGASEEWAEFLEEDPEAAYDQDESVVIESDPNSARSSFLPGHWGDSDYLPTIPGSVQDEEEPLDESYEHEHDRSTVYTEYDDDCSCSDISDDDDPEGPRVIQPEPEPFRPDKLKAPRAIKFKQMYGRQGRPLQVVVKLESVELSPKRNKYPGRVWHLAGKQVGRFSRWRESGH